jgi:hypothetical protein
MWKIFALGAALSMMTSAVSAEPPCEQRNKLVQKLAKKYQETSVAIGVGNDGKLVEVLSNDNGGTWTIIVTSPAGVSCLVAAGEGWRSIDAPVGEPEA